MEIDFYFFSHNEKLPLGAVEKIIARDSKFGKVWYNSGNLPNGRFFMAKEALDRNHHKEIPRSEIKAVIFDLGGVLAGNEWPLIYQKLEEDLGVSQEKAREVIWSLFGKLSVGEISEPEFWHQFEVETESKLPEGYADMFWRQTYTDWSKDDKEVWEILEQIKTSGLKTALLSNIIDTHASANEMMGRLEKGGFDVVIWSSEVGLRKPDPRIYQLMLEKLGFSPQECIFIDDQEKNILAAQEIGIHGIHFQSAEQLNEELGNLGILSS